MSYIAVVMFDGGGVLTNGIPNCMLRNMCKELENTADMDEFKRTRMIETLSAATEHPTVKQSWTAFKKDSNFSESMYWENFLSVIPLPGYSVDQMKSMVRDSMEVDEDTLRIANRIYHSFTESGERRLIGILSNHSNEWFGSYVQKGNILSVFPQDMIFISQSIGYAKPEMGIFQHAMMAICQKRPGTQLEEVLFFDDKQENVDAARAFGWRAERFKRETDSHEVMVEHLRNHNIIL